MEIDTVKYINTPNNEKIIKLTYKNNIKTFYLMEDSANTDYQAIQEWVDKGNKIEEAD